jgi:uncharacterized protein (TIGR03067 family)
MKPCVAFALVVAFLVAADDPKKENDKSKDDKEKVYGTWEAIGFEENGKILKEEQLKEGAKGMKWVLSDGKLLIKQGNSEGIQCTVKFDPSKNPRTMDVMVAEGPKKGDTLLAIYTLEKDTLKVCLGSKERPKEFKTASGSGHAIIVFKREKP